MNKKFSILSLVAMLFFLVQTIFAALSTPAFKTVTTQHQITLQGNVLHYHATVGTLPYKDKTGKVIATMSYIAYTKDGTDLHRRPLTLIYDGGPGLSSLIFNFLNAGPKIITTKTEMATQGALKDNPLTWLPFTDEVYIDMVGTGWGRLANEKYSDQVYSTDPDADTFSQFIANYLQKYNRQQSPLYLAGESYAGFRSALISQQLLQKHAIRIKGIVYISPLLDFKTVVASYANNLAYIAFLPAYTQLALHYHKLSADLEKHPNATIKAVRHWALTHYQRDLFLGDSLSKHDRQNLAATLAKYTGLPSALIIKNHYLISPDTFRQSLLADKHVVLDTTDGRYFHQESKKNDALEGALLLHYVALLSQSALPYLKTGLAVNTNEPYIIDAQAKVQKHWDWSIHFGQPVAPEVLSILHDYLMQNPQTKIFFGLGYYDLDVPYFGSIRNIDQLQLNAKQKEHIDVHFYPAGHVVYWDTKARATMFKDIKQFYHTQG